jgi:hypothetical protein
VVLSPIERKNHAVSLSVIKSVVDLSVANCCIIGRIIV